MRYDFHTYQYDHTFELMEGALYFDKNGGIAHRTKQPAIAQRASAKGGWHTLPDGTKVQGERQLRQLIDADEQLRNMIYKAMMMGN